MDIKQYLKSIESNLKNSKSSQAIIIFPKKEYFAKGLFLDKDKNISFNFDVVIGKNGFGKEVEGDNKTPIGIFNILFGFGHQSITNQKFLWKVVGDNDYWIDDSSSQYYNRHIYSLTQPKESCEKLNNPLYRYTLVYDYNFSYEKNRGSALFIHIWKNSNHPTAGCTAMSEENLIKIVSLLNNRKNPILFQGNEEFYKNLMEN